MIFLMPLTPYTGCGCSKQLVTSTHLKQANTMKRTLLSILGVAAVALSALPAHAQWATTCTRDPRSSVNLRNGPSKNNYIIASIPNDSYIRAMRWVYGGDGLRWYNVEYDGIVGWMRSDYLCR